MTTILATTLSRCFRPVLATYAAFAAVTALTLGTLTGCASEPEPAASATPAFASEAEAFAAAEEVYRAYNEALNNIDPSDPATFEPLYELSSGEFEEHDRKNFSVMHAEGHTISGDAVVTLFEGQTSTPLMKEVTALVCLDVSAVRIQDAAGESLVNPNRPNVYPLAIRFEQSDGRFLIKSAQRTEDSACTAL